MLARFKSLWRITEWFKMFGLCILKSRQIRAFVSFKSAALFFLPLLCGLSHAATATSSVVLISPVNVMTSIAVIAPVVSISAGWVTVRLSVPQLKQFSGIGPGLQDEITGRPAELHENMEAAKPELVLKGQPIVSLNLSKGNASPDAAGVPSAAKADKLNDYKLTVVFN